MVSLDFNNDDDKKNNKEINSIELMKFILDFFFWSSIHLCHYVKLFIINLNDENKS